jgi:hypothetical protein
MHRPTETARWYRRVDPRCFPDQNPSNVADEARLIVSPAAHRHAGLALRVRRAMAMPAHWIAVAYASLTRTPRTVDP